MNKRKMILLLICINLFVIVLAGLKIGNEKQESILFQDAYTGDKWLRLDAYDVARGVYRVTVRYETNRTECTIGMSTEEQKYNERYRWLREETHSLSPNENELSYDIWLNHGTDMLCVIVDCGDVEKEDTYLILHEISIDRSWLGSTAYEMLKVLLVLGILDVAAFFALNGSWVKKNFYVLLGIISITFISSLGIMMDPLPSGHDLPFHLSRIWGLGQGLAAGEFPVKIQPGWCNGYGYAVSIFYGDALLYFPAALTLLKIPLDTAYKAYVIIINLGTALTSFFTFKKISGNKEIGVVCSAAYTFSLYRICNIYVRAAVGEYTAMMFIPLVILGMWEILSEDVKQKDYRSKWVWLCIGMTGLIQSHVLSCEMVGIFLIITCVVWIKRVFRKQTFIVLAKSVIATLFLNAGFLIPFLDYAREELSVFTEHEFYRIQQYGMSIYELFSINTTGSGLALPANNGLEGRLSVSLGFISILAFLLTITVIRMEEISKREKQRLIAVLLLTGGAVWAASVWFPWDSLQRIKGLKQVIGSLQFPFRYLSIAMGFAILMLGLTLKICCESEKIKKHAHLLLIGFLLICMWQGMQYMDRAIRENGSKIVCEGTAMIADRESMIGAEYSYMDTDHDKAINGGKLLSEAQISAVERDGNQFVISLRTEEETYLKVPLFYYPDYQCMDTESKEKLPVIKGDNNELWVKVPAGYDGTVRIAFVEPWTWRIAELCSFFTLIIFIGYRIRPLGELTKRTAHVTDKDEKGERN